MFSRLSIVAILGAALITSVAAGTDTLYPIKLHRPAKVGETYDLRHVVEASGTSVMTIGARPPETRPSTPLAGELSGRCTVTEVDAAGNATALSIVIQHFVVNAKEALPAGSQLDIKRRRDDIACKSNGKDVDGRPAEVLHLLYAPIGIADIGDDEAFGTGTPRSVGDAWPVNVDAIAELKTTGDNKVEPKKVTGQTTLKGVERSGETAALRVVTKFNMSDFFKPADLPDVISIDASERTFEITRLLPIDVNGAPLEVEQVVDYRQQEHTKPPAEPTTLSQTQHIHIRSTFIKRSDSVREP